MLKARLLSVNRLYRRSGFKSLECLDVNWKHCNQWTARIGSQKIHYLMQEIAGQSCQVSGRQVPSHLLINVEFWSISVVLMFSQVSKPKLGFD